jgi:SAM-dependent methyltransferase
MTLEEKLLIETAKELLHLGCGEDYREDFLNVDVDDSVNPDHVIDLNDTPWPFPDEEFRHILARHCFEHLDDLHAALRECTRLLRDGGTVKIALPMGLDQRADQTHQHDWTWRTAEFATGVRHWDDDVGLELVEREVTLWSQLPGWERRLYQTYLDRRLDKYGPGEWCFGMPAVSGEFEITYRKA